MIVKVGAVKGRGEEEELTMRRGTRRDRPHEVASIPWDEEFVGTSDGKKKWRGKERKRVHTGVTLDLLQSMFHPRRACAFFCL